jgi:hypothetical protein
MQQEDALPIEEWVRAARVYAAERVGWFAPALYAAPLQLADALPHPAAIDRYGRVYFSPRWVAQLYEACGRDRHRLVPQLAQIWYHEVAHWLRAHGERAETLGADAVLWNLAADMEINDYLPEGLAYPSLGDEPLVVLPRQFQLPDGEVAEWYYQRLLEERESPLTPTLSPLTKGGEGEGSGGIQQHEKPHPRRAQGAGGFNRRNRATGVDRRSNPSQLQISSLQWAGGTEGAWFPSRSGGNLKEGGKGFRG